jgi:hypothetical protein
MKMEEEPASETSWFYIIYFIFYPDDGQSPEDKWFLKTFVLLPEHSHSAISLTSNIKSLRQMCYSVGIRKGGAKFRGIRNTVLLHIARAVFLPNFTQFVKSSLVMDLNSHVFIDCEMCFIIPACKLSDWRTILCLGYVIFVPCILLAL